MPAEGNPIGWHFLVDPPLPGVINMTVDRALLERAEVHSRPVTWVRLYSWDRPTVSLGRNQTPAAVNRAFCKQNSIPIVRRPTGGRAVYHADELTYSVISNDQAVFPMGSILETYHSIALVLQDGLSQLGIQSVLAQRNRELYPATEDQFEPGPGKPPCFASASRYELLVGGRKIAGSAQRRLRRSFLQHGSIPIRIESREMARALAMPTSILESTITCVSAEAPQPVSFSKLASCLKSSFAAFFKTPRL
jgi:lipoate-protein ligase A